MSDRDTLAEATPAEELVEAIGVAWMRHQGYSDGEIETASNQTCRDAGCEPFDAGFFGTEFAGSTAYDCTNESGESNHPIRDALLVSGEIANLAVETVEAKGWRPPARTVSEEEANRLMPGAIVRRGGKAWEREHGLWWHGGLLDGYAVPYGSAPITVLYDPAEENDDAH